MNSTMKVKQDEIQNLQNQLKNIKEQNKILRKELDEANSKVFEETVGRDSE
jgi:cell shape-determining protein MreC